MAGKITEMTALSGALALTDLVEVVDDPGGTPLTRKATWQLVKDLLGGQVVQVVNTQSGAVATGTTILPADDSIPQQTEGVEVMTLAVTPTNATHKLKIEVVVFFGNSVNNWMTAALFQDATAGALAAGEHHVNAGLIRQITFTHYMTAGTTSATTFKVRIGGDAAGTTTLNGVTSARLMGGVMASSITITEVRA